MDSVRLTELNLLLFLTAGLNHTWVYSNMFACLFDDMIELWRTSSPVKGFPAAHRRRRQQQERARSPWTRLSQRVHERARFIRCWWARWCEFNKHRGEKSVGTQQDESREFRRAESWREASAEQETHTWYDLWKESESDQLERARKHGAEPRWPESWDKNTQIHHSVRNVSLETTRVVALETRCQTKSHQGTEIQNTPEIASGTG